MKSKLINHYQKIQFLLLLGLSGFPILPKGIQSVLIVLMGFFAIFYFFIEGKKYWNNEKTKQLVVLGSLFFIYSISILYTDNFKWGGKYITRLAPMILVSLVFLTTNVTILKKDSLYKLLTTYSISLVILLLFLYFSFFDKIYDNNITPWELRSYIEELTNIHGTYLSMWIGMCVLTTFWFLCKIWRKFWLRILGVFLLLFLFYWLYIIGARMPFFAALIASVFLLLHLFNVSIKTILIIFIIAGFSGFTIFKTTVFSKIQELSDYQNAIPTGKYENTNPLISNENIRSVIYYCSLKNIMDAPLFGYGVGDVNRELQECYDEKFSHTDIFKRFQFNSHSQYLQIILSSGFIGFFLYLISLVMLIKLSPNRVKLYSSFLILAFLCFTFENILYRHDGIVFFSFFNSILFFTENREK